jgi:hypothetical protein
VFCPVRGNDKVAGRVDPEQVPARGKRAWWAEDLDRTELLAGAAVDDAPCSDEGLPGWLVGRLRGKPRAHVLHGKTAAWP